MAHCQQRHRFGRSNHLAAAIALGLLCALCAVSCVQGPEPASETEAQAPAIETKDEGDLYGDPNIGIGSPPPLSPMVWEPGESASPGGWFTYNLCCRLKNGPTFAREAFCRSQADYEIRKSCFSHTYDSPVKWQNWCYDTFRNE